MDNTCFDVAQGEDMAIVLGHVAARFERNGITPDAETSKGILALAQKTACP